MTLLLLFACGAAESEDSAQFAEGYDAGCAQAETEAYDDGYADGLACEAVATAKCGSSHYGDGFGAGYDACYAEPYTLGHTDGWAAGGCP